jgi:hypothetical protein
LIKTGIFRVGPYKRKRLIAYIQIYTEKGEGGKREGGVEGERRERMNQVCTAQR